MFPLSLFKVIITRCAKYCKHFLKQLCFICLTIENPRHYNNTMKNVIEKELEDLFKTDGKFLEICQQFRWGKIEIAVKDGKPVMISVRRDIKLD